MKKHSIQPVILSLLLVIIMLIAGISGYMLIERYSFTDAFFMTINTVATVGFSTGRSLSGPGMYFTSFLIIFSVGTFAFAVTTLTRYVMEGVFRNYYRDNKVKSKIEKKISVPRPARPHRSRSPEALAPKRAQKWLFTLPVTPARPNSSVPGESSWTTTPVGVRASLHRINRRLMPCATWPRVSPTNSLPRSSNTTLPSAPKISNAVTQVVMPGSSELIAVSRVQSKKLPFGIMNRRVASTWARVAVATAGER